MAHGHIVLVTTKPLQSGEPIRTVYYVAEEDVMAPNEEAEALAVLEESAVNALGLKQGEFRRAEPPRPLVDDELTQALEGTFPASDPLSLESTLVPGGSRRQPG